MDLIVEKMSNCEIILPHTNLTVFKKYVQKLNKKLNKILGEDDDEEEEEEIEPTPEYDFGVK